jgi:hypothetical protein
MRHFPDGDSLGAMPGLLQKRDQIGNQGRIGAAGRQLLPQPGQCRIAIPGTELEDRPLSWGLRGGGAGQQDEGDQGGMERGPHGSGRWPGRRSHEAVACRRGRSVDAGWELVAATQNERPSDGPCGC